MNVWVMQIAPPLSVSTASVSDVQGCSKDSTIDSSRIPPIIRWRIVPLRRLTPADRITRTQVYKTIREDTDVPLYDTLRDHLLRPGECSECTGR